LVLFLWLRLRPGDDARYIGILPRRRRVANITIDAALAATFRLFLLALLSRHLFLTLFERIVRATLQDGLPATATAATVAAATAAATAATTTTEAATAAATAAGALTSLADRNRAALQLAPIEGRDRSSSTFLGGHLDKTETARTTGVTVEHQLGLDDLVALSLEGVQQISLGRGERKISYVQSLTHIRLRVVFL
jgi:hypothetical protein